MIILFYHGFTSHPLLYGLFIDAAAAAALVVVAPVAVEID